MPYVGVVLAGVQLFFLTLNNFIASPFQMLGGRRRTAPCTGSRAPMATDSIRCCSIRRWSSILRCFTPATPASPFHSLSRSRALLGRYPGEKWIHLTRRWTMIAWGFQGVGILLGAHWAYAVLGWGGYWSWDPVENASLMPWLTGTAFLHSVMMQEKRGMMRVWNVWLVFITFLLTIFGTSLTRSGMVNSVHAFAQSTIGPWFFGFLGLVLADLPRGLLCRIATICAATTNSIRMVSRESSFLFNNLILLVACVAILSGTLFPVLSEWVRGTKDQRRRAVLQQGESADRPVPAVPDRRRAAAGVAQDLARKSAPQLWRGRCWSASRRGADRRGAGLRDFYVTSA